LHLSSTYFCSQCYRTVTFALGLHYVPAILPSSEILFYMREINRSYEQFITTHIRTKRGPLKTKSCSRFVESRIVMCVGQGQFVENHCHRLQCGTEKINVAHYKLKRAEKPTNFSLILCAFFFFYHRTHKTKPRHNHLIVSNIFDKAEPNSLSRGIGILVYFRNNLIRIWVSFICKLSETPDEGLPPPDTRSLCPLSSTEFVEPPRKKVLA
jgi:hypothetical protein